MHPRKSGPGGAPCFGQFGDGIIISKRLAGALGTTGGCGFPVATRMTVGPSEPSSLADFLGPVPRYLVLAAPSELLRGLGSSSTSPTFLCADRGRNPCLGAGEVGACTSGRMAQDQSRSRSPCTNLFPTKSKTSRTGSAKGIGAVVSALCKWDSWIGLQPITVHSDHHSLQHWHSEAVDTPSGLFFQTLL